MAYDIHQVIRYHLARENTPQGGFTTDFDNPIQYSNEPIANVERVEK